MGNGARKLTLCFTKNRGGGVRQKQDVSILITVPLDEGLKPYVRPDPNHRSSSKVHFEETTTFRTISGTSVSPTFHAGFLKQLKWNNALLDMFRIKYVGTSPYITYLPYLRHHKLGPKDKFLILSFDKFYQYLTNEEVVAEV